MKFKKPGQSAVELIGFFLHAMSFTFVALLPLFGFAIANLRRAQAVIGNSLAEYRAGIGTRVLKKNEKPGLALLVALLSVSGTAVGQTGPGPGNPQWNVNIVGPTKEPADIRDFGLRQQNEPACAIRPGDSACIICAYNDYRTLDVPAVGDAWQGVSMSCDSGTTWFSRVAPGSGADQFAPIDAKFAADPRIVAIPGMAIINFIGGFRGEDRGVLAIQHWLESNQEDGDFNEPGRYTIIAETGTDGRFIDKPELLAVLDEGNQASTVMLSTVMENPELGTIDRSYPSGTLYLAYAVFTGSQSVKVMVKTSPDWGQTWLNKSTKLTESQNLVSGITMTAMKGIVLAVWRQAGDVNDVDAMYYSLTTNNGKAWSKPAVLTNICQFDQGSITTATNALPFQGKVTFRTNDFPWVANDGKNFYMFYSDRKGTPNQVCDGTGVAKVYFRYSADGKNWSNPRAIDESAESAPGYQFMPAAFGANGKVQVAWYDTRRENIVTLNEIADYSPNGSAIVNRKIDVYTARVSENTTGTVVVSPSTRVSQYRTIFDTSEPVGDDAPPTLYEIDASFGNAMLYGSGFLSFLGDYIAVAGQEFRRNGNGWVSNSSAASSDPDLNKADFFIAWADNRDLRGDFLFGTPGVPPSQYTPPDNLPPPGPGAALSPEARDVGVQADALLSATSQQAAVISETGENERQSTEGVEDTPVDPNIACVLEQDRTRDANIYGSLIRDEKLRMAAPTPSKPLNGVQRAYPVALTNTNPDSLAYRLHIATTLAPSNVNRASFRQQPAHAPFPGAPMLDELIEDLTIPANSTFARTVFVSSTNTSATVRVNAYDGTCATAADSVSDTEFMLACPILASIVLGGTAQAGPLQQPDYESGACDGNPDCYDDVLLAELHNPLLENPLLENPLLENPLLENPLLENPLLENPLLENPLLENPLLENPLLENYGFANPLLENPLLENPLLENPLLENPLLENPLLENPLLENPLLENSAPGDGIYYMDITAAIKNDGNVTTAYSADLTVTSSMADPKTASQLIAWTQYVTPTSRDCNVRAQVENQVLAAVQNPDAVLNVAEIDDPFAGQISFIAAPGQTVFVTHRVFGTAAELQAISISGFTTSAQAANCIDDNGAEGGTYTCADSLREDNEQILLDTIAPVFNIGDPGQPIPQPPIEADRTGGACVDLVGSGLVTASDESPVTISCSLVDSGEELCTASDPLNGLSIPVMTLADPDPTAVSCTATDEPGNSTTIELLIAVGDSGKPFFTIFPMAPVELPAGAGGTAMLDFESQVVAVDVDFVDLNPEVSCMTSGGLGSDDPLPAGSHTVICTAMDASGNVSDPALEYTVNVNDETAPTLALVPGTGLPVQLDADAVTGTAPFDFTSVVIATDNVDPAPLVSCAAVTNPGGVPSSSPLATGAYTVSCIATDATGNISAPFSYGVNVNDVTPPTFLTVPSSFTAEATGASGAENVTYPDPTATDSAGDVTVDCAPASGSTFPLGVTTVTCTATDEAGLTATVSFDVTVEDTTPPTLENVPDDITVTTFALSADVDYSAGITATDLVDGTREVTCTRDDDPASNSITFTYGTWGITCTASDTRGNTGTATFDVIVSFSFGINLVLPKGQAKAGSTIPIDWQYTDLTPGNVGNPVDSSFINPQVIWIGPFQDNDSTCSGWTDNSVSGDDSGSSGKRYDSLTKTWQFSWQTPNVANKRVLLVISPPGVEFAAARRCVRLR